MAAEPQVPNGTWFCVLPDGEGALAASRLLGAQAAGTLSHGSGRPWLVGCWTPGHVTAAEAGPARLAVIGRCPVTAAELSARLRRVRSVDQVERAVAGLAGSFHVVASVGGRVRVRGSASGVRRVVHARVAGTTVAADCSDVLATAIGARLEESVLASRLLPPGSSYPLEERSVWRDVEVVPADCCLLLDDDGHAQVRRWWRAPRPVLRLPQGAAVVREALSAAVATCTGGGTVSADLSGGMDSTSLCFLAARGPSSLVTAHQEALDPANDDGTWARRAREALPDAEHILLGRARLPSWFEGVTDALEPIEEPAGWARDPARLRYAAERLVAAGSRLHLVGAGADELFSPTPAYLHDLIRDRPLAALPHLRGYRVQQRKSWRRVLFELAGRATFADWSKTCAAGLRASGAAPGSLDLMSWGPAPHLPPWATPQAVQAVRNLLRETAANRPPPLAPQRAQHLTLQFARVGGGEIRQVDHATGRFGVRYAAPFLDDAVIEAVLSVRLDERASPHRYKPLLTAAMGGIVPDPLLRRSTKGDYGADLYAALSRQHAELLKLFEAPLLARLGLIDAEALRAFLRAPHPHPAAFAPLLQTLACELWLRSRPEFTQARPDTPATGGLR